MMLLGVLAMDSSAKERKGTFSFLFNRILGHGSFKCLRSAWLSWTPKSYKTCVLRSLVKETKLDELVVGVRAKLELPGKEGSVAK